MSVNRPSIVGKYTNDLVYLRLAPGILTELQNRNPKDEKGHRKAKYHQWLTAIPYKSKLGILDRLRVDHIIDDDCHKRYAALITGVTEP